MVLLSCLKRLPSMAALKAHAERFGATEWPSCTGGLGAIHDLDADILRSLSIGFNMFRPVVS